MPFAELEDITISYQDTGVPVNVAKYDTFDPLLPDLSVDYRLIAYDRCGYGKARATTVSSTGTTHPSDLLALIGHMRASGAVPWSAGAYHVLLAMDDVPVDRALPFDALLLYNPPDIPIRFDGAGMPATFCRKMAAYHDPATGEKLPNRNSLDIMPAEPVALCSETDNPETFAYAKTRLDENVVARVLPRVCCLGK